MLLTGVATLVSVSLFAQDARTVVNGEPAPLLFRFLSSPASIAEAAAADLVAMLQSEPAELVLVPPQGLWQLPANGGTIVGYFAGGPSGVSYRVVRRDVTGGIEPVVINRDDLAVVNGRSVTMTPWQLPDLPDSILVDGDSLDWEGIEPELRFGSLFRPSRIEHAVTGEEISLSEAQFWGTGGTRLFDLRMYRGVDSLYVAVQSYQDFGDGTALHLRVFDDRAEAMLGEAVAVFDGPGGIVVIRRPGGRVTLAGRYARRGRFTEFDVRYDALAELIDGSVPRPVTLDLASSIGIGERIEQFTFASFDPGISLPR